ncbi:hypothetical protein EB809_04120 [Marinobacter sp. R17]|uniref:MalM family protein n=1 Tax=Marinobacter sp. R17 TaxID=2484250 RepID=UPI000F4BE920|nr:MalM family protein [Marinobacter sp. R17]ROU01647.1 hypothetical protein EB809_04120 [Marinobacter sp. R17]
MAGIQHRLGLFIGIGLSAVASFSHGDDRYFTWVDEQGRVHSSLIKEEENPVQKRIKAVESGKKAGATSSESASIKTTSEHPAATVKDPEPVAPKTAPKVEIERNADVSLPAPESDVPAANTPPKSPAEQNKPERVAREPKPNPGPEDTTEAAETAAEEPSAPPKADSEYNLENYPDGDELAKKGFVREGDPLPYYTWRDANGQVRVDYYRPEPGFEKKSQGREAPRLSEAMVIDGRSPAASQKANPETLAVLGIDQTETLLQSWQDRCCNDLPVKDLAEWDDSREFQVDLDDMAPEFRFSTGSSVYRLVKLPTASESGAFVMQVRSYENHGVFVPTLVFLDEGMQARRMVTDLVFDYRPENWHRQGYIEARVPVFPDHGDRWLLIMSRGSDQAGQTVLEADGAPQVIHHAAQGMVSLAQLGG